MLKDQAGNEWGDMEYPTSENTFTYILKRAGETTAMQVEPAPGIRGANNGEFSLSVFVPNTLVTDISNLELEVRYEDDVGCAGDWPRFVVAPDNDGCWNITGPPVDSVDVNYTAMGELHKWKIDFGGNILEIPPIGRGTPVIFHLILKDGKNIIAERYVPYIFTYIHV